MNKADLIETLSKKGGIPVSRAHNFVDIVFDAMHDSLVSGQKVMISDFGSFTLSSRKAFRGHNPQNGKPVDVPSVRVPVFKAGKGLKADLNK